ncbi:glutaredoxin domain-containing protein [Yoonia sp. 2307UL14-13]|uniref:glutaredoxin domain-containing protein n=1 Tax=Yoonia sp. 2307UL14-13 TaxID=3126506 RepID=UPI0030A46FF2
MRIPKCQISPSIRSTIALIAKQPKALLTAKGKTFRNIDITDHPTKRQKMIAVSQGRNTVPQIFIGDFHIGGYSELAKLDAAGKLDTLLYQLDAA